MSKHRKDPLLEALKAGESYTWTIPDGGDLASMRAAIKHGQTLTMSPIGDPGEIQVGDMVLVKWHKSDIFHLVGEIQDGKFLITNSMGGANGWVNAEEILGRVTAMVEPEPRPDVPALLEQLKALYRQLVESEALPANNALRLLTVASDLQWYAGRIGEERWDKMPRSNKWSFHQNLWRLTKQARGAIAPVPQPIHFFIDEGKKCVGLAAEILTLFALNKSN
ncbi:MAG: hypothetical protein JXA21_02910 [Anaerolineae bacterium]|nr:hypothetical protein [Anaerolineae bacterium]